MKNYRVLMANEPAKDGRFDIVSSIPLNTTYQTLEEFSELKKLAEKDFLKDATEVIENCLFLKKSNQHSGFIQTLQLYETVEGVIVEVVQDDFEGLMVESEDKDIIEKIYQRLLKM